MFLKDKKMLSKAQQDERFMNELLGTEEAEKFIKYVIKSFTKNPALFMQQHQVEWEDLYQACLLGLFNGIKKLNLNLSPNEWVRYVYLTIQGEIRNFSRTNYSNSIGVSQKIRMMYPKYLLFYQQYREAFSQDPTIEETMKQFELTRDEAFSLVYGMQQVISLYQESGNDTDLTIADYAVKNPLGEVENIAVNKVLIETYMTYLSNKQKEIIYMHYFLGLNKSEIANIIGCASSTIYKQIDNAFKKIRELEMKQFKVS